MPLTPGQKLSVYEILEPLGAGAMGEVYRARDVRLQRDVAIKVLPEHFANDEERLRRFEREARTLASLNHPNVAQIFGVDQVGDTSFLVLELVEGESLGDRLERGALPIRDALEVGRQIAEGLEAAHEAGIIHRDLKPANVQLTSDGKAKVLDFGLAKPALSAEAAATTDSVLSTETGRLLGTPTHMAPEQARGKPIDRRVDVWAFGCVLFECLTGRRTFGGDSLTDVLAGVLEREPDWAALPAGVPPRVRRLLERCLTKEPRDRLRDIGDARLELVDALARREEDPAPRAAGNHRAALAWGVASVAAAVALWLALGVGSSPTQEAQAARRLAIDLPPGTTVLNPGNFSFDVSEDGRWVVFCGLKGAPSGVGGQLAEAQESQLYVRELGRFDCTPLPGTERASGPFFSPDARWIAYFDRGAGKLRKIPRSGGAVIDLCDCPDSSRGGDWSENGILVFSRGISGGLFTVPEGGGEPKPLAVPNWSQGEKSYRHPAFLPDRTHVLATFSTSTLWNYDDADIVRISLETGDVETVLEGGSTPRYARSGHLLFARAGELDAVGFDVGTGRISGAPFLVQNGLLTSDNHGTAQYAISNGGTLVYLPGGPEQDYTELVLLDADGAEGEPIALDPAQLFGYTPSPDGTRLAIHTGGGNDFLQVYDLGRGLSTRLNAGGWDSVSPMWSADGERVIFSSNRNGRYDLYWQRADGSDAPELLLASESDLFASSMTSDDGLLVYEERDLSNRGDILVLPLEAQGRAGSPKPILSDPYSETSGAVSQDGSWIAYESDETGETEVYIRAFPEGARRWQVSRSGGVRPSWSRDGSRLRYLGPEGLLEVDLSKGPGTLGDARLVQAWGDLLDIQRIESPTGQLLVGMRTVEKVRRESLHVVLGLFTELGSTR